MPQVLATVSQCLFPLFEPVTMQEGYQTVLVKGKCSDGLATWGNKATAWLDSPCCYAIPNSLTSQKKPCFVQFNSTPRKAKNFRSVCLTASSQMYIILRARKIRSSTIAKLPSGLRLVSTGIRDYLGTFLPCRAVSRRRQVWRCARSHRISHVAHAQQHVFSGPHGRAAGLDLSSTTQARRRDIRGSAYHGDL